MHLDFQNSFRNYFSFNLQFFFYLLHRTKLYAILHNQRLQLAVGLYIDILYFALREIVWWFLSNRMDYDRSDSFHFDDGPYADYTAGWCRSWFLYSNHHTCDIFLINDNILYCPNTFLKTQFFSSSGLASGRKPRRTTP